MKRGMMKKVLPLLFALMMAMVSFCSAESWQFIGSEGGSDRDYYIDFDSAWYNEVNGGGLARIVSTNTGFSGVFTIQFVDNQDGSFDVTVTNGKAYDKDGNLLYGTDTNIEHHSESNSMLAKGCQAIIAMVANRQ